MRTKKEFNWFTELDKAIASPPSMYMRNHLRDRAGLWVTCACGQLCKDLPRDAGEPIDRYLYHMGIDFSNMIEEMDWRSARVLLDKIEARSSYLLSKL